MSVPESTSFLEENSWNELNLDDNELQLLLDQPLEPQNSSNLESNLNYSGFDSSLGDKWIYPSNWPCRSYQFNIAQAALYRNTMVVLPTGLGKTFIAAVVMYNFYRWYPEGKVIFMAPTRPLVSQQIEACQRIMPFADDDTVELTGKLQRMRRSELWKTKRVFFATPQVVQSDIISYEDNSAKDRVNFPFKQVKLIVIDEAHKAKGRYAYSDVTQAVWYRNRYFRVLALTATPGRTMEDVAEVVRNLYISHLEVRSDSSIDVMQYIHQRSIRKVVVPLGEHIKAIREELLQIIDPYLRQLIKAEVLGGSLTTITKNFLLFEQKRFRNRSINQRHKDQSMVNRNFSICISLHHAMELLERHGMRVFLNSFDDDDEGRGKFILSMDKRLRQLVERLRKEVGPDPFKVSVDSMTNGQIAEMPNNLDFGHPKFEEAGKCLLEHFQNTENTRAIVFCEYRESVMLMYRLLLQHKPILNPRCFVGQGGNTGFLRALTQKQQIQIMADFRSGKCNILIATSIGEEGIDVGEVDLIVCFDISTSNPTRFVQRIGRTGRKKQGHVVMLVTEGREQQILQDVLAHKDQLNKRIQYSTIVRDALYRKDLRLVPDALKPECLKTFIKSPEKKTKPTSKKETKIKEKATKGKSANNLPIKGSQDLREFFKKPKVVKLDEKEREIFDTTRHKRSSLANIEVINIDDDDDVEKVTIESLPSVTCQIGVCTQERRNRTIAKIDDYFKDITSNNLIKSNTQITTDLEIANTEPEQESAKPEEIPNASTILSKPEFCKQLKGSKLSLVEKLDMLKQNREYVREIFDNMTIINALVMDADEVATSDEREICKKYELIESIFDGKENLEKFLDNKSDDTSVISLDSEENICEKENIDSSSTSAISETKSNNDFQCMQDKLRKRFEYKIMLSKLPMSERKSRVMVFDSDDSNEDNDTDTMPDFTSAINKCNKQKNFNINHLPTNCMSTPLKNDPLADALHRLHNKMRNISLLKTLSEQSMIEDDGNPIFTANKSESCLNPETTTVTTNSKEFSLSCSEHEDANDLEKSPLIDFLYDQDSYSPFEIYANNSPDPTIISELYDEPTQLLNCESTPKAKDVPNTMNFNDNDGSNCSQKSSVLYNDKENNSPVLIKRELTSIPIATISSERYGKRNFQEVPFNCTPQNSSINIPIKVQKESSKPSERLNSLDIDMEAFLEPFPEEDFYISSVSQAKKSPSFLEDTKSFEPDIVETSNAKIPRFTPDIFGFDDSKTSCNTTKRTSINFDIPPKITLAAKLAAKCLEFRSDLNKKNQPQQCTTTAPVIKSTNEKNEILESPTQKSPSIFDRYMRRRVKRISIANDNLCTDEEKRNLMSKQIVNEEQCDSFLVRKTSKRKIFLSDSEIDENESTKSIEVDEQTQILKEDNERYSSRKFKRKRRKRVRVCSFFDNEAGVSGNDQSDDEEDESRYRLDSVVVESDEEEDNADAIDDMHGVYLQSIKSPPHVPGAFTLPGYREYKDSTHIYSQAVPVESSQYALDSFIVNEVDSEDDESYFCPLERAEKILKERKRARRQQGAQGFTKVPGRKKIILISDSSNSS